ncbi:sulfatase-like hydrolase/transferase [Ulvibacterium marinum]|uniref:sulfatase-like hydrolase/transferase n=1 Tax=Ulvibacterium marinum TaxID=2419782 RepID=UPI00249413BC|nr:sulfatase-like hydrolase/transferase [Ulvibacterium marinum]
MRKLLILIPCLLIFACKTEKKEEPAKPNIVFIFADDMTYSALHALGNDEIETPNLDHLVRNGTSFTHAFNMGGWNGAICVASRSMIISGRSIWDAQKMATSWSQGREMEKTWGRLMEKSGYETYMTGKWHVKAPADSVFQNVVHVRPGMPRDSWSHQGTIPIINEMLGNGASESEIRSIGYNRPLNENDTLWTPTDKKYGGFWQGGKHWSEVLKDDALGFLNKAGKSDKPFFMYLAFNAPHDPRQAPQEYLDKYPLENISVPKSFLPEYPFKDGIGNGPDLRDEALAPFPRTEYAVKKHIQEYYALITHLDDQIGQILEGLEATGKGDNTYIVFTADHGLSVGRHGLLGKQSQFDHSVRAPFMIMGPDIPKNKKVETDIYLQDAMATSLDLAGIEKPQYVFFNSVLPLLGEKKENQYPSIYGSYVDTQRMIRKEGFKLMVYPKLNKVLLFDLQNDPEEMNDISENEEHKEKVNELFQELLELQKEMKDTLDLSHIRA